MLSEAVRVPAAEGLNMIAIVQLPPAATGWLHVSFSVKSAASAPLKAMLLMLKVALPVLLRVTVCAVLMISSGWLPKARLVGERLTRAAVPVPERLTVWGLPLALSEMLTAAVRLPLAEGVNVTLIVQLALAASDLPHVLLVSAKLLPLVPLTARLVMLKGVLPVLLRVTV